MLQSERKGAALHGVTNPPMLREEYAPSESQKGSQKGTPYLRMLMEGRDRPSVHPCRVICGGGRVLFSDFMTWADGGSRPPISILKSRIPPCARRTRPSL